MTNILWIFVFLIYPQLKKKNKVEMKNSFFDYKNNKKVYKTKMSTLVRYLFILVLTLGFAFELGKNALSIESRQNNYK